MQVLTPGVKHGEKADGGSEESGMGSGLEQRLGCTAKQNSVNLPRILERQPADLGGQREHNVEIGDGQKFGFALGQPAGASLSLTLGTVPVATPVI